jgi:hypothetical protein
MSMDVCRAVERHPRPRILGPSTPPAQRLWSAPMGCPSCGRANPPAARFCMKCGGSLTSAARATVEGVKGG